MSIGYACLTVGVPNTNQKSCILKNASDERLLDIISHNLNSLENSIEYNIKSDIKLFRISSDLIPFGSSPVNSLPWWDIFFSQLLKIGEKIKNSGMRVSMHPGQYTVLNSPNEDVVKRAIADLKYHTRVLDSLGVGVQHKIVLHIGGIYHNKKQAIDRFVTNYHCLDERVKQRIVLENDDKAYPISDVLEIGTILNTPVVFDNLHHAINASNAQRSDYYWINECRKTWQEKDGVQKIHYSQQNSLKKTGSHSGSIRINEFIHFYENLKNKEIDIMLEVKDKNLSAVKCINCTSKDKSIKALELEWSKYKDTVLESSPLDYVLMQKLLCNKKNYPAISFYNLLEDALETERTMVNSGNAALHVWNYFKDSASDKERNNFFKNMDAYQNGKITMNTIKNNLWEMAVKYNQPEDLNSYYFVL